MYLIFYTLVGDGGTVREVHARLVQAETMEQAKERLNGWFGAPGYLHIVKVERVG